MLKRENESFLHETKKSSTYHAPNNVRESSHCIQQSSKGDWMDHISITNELIETLLLQIPHIIGLPTLHINRTSILKRILSIS